MRGSLEAQLVQAQQAMPAAPAALPETPGPAARPMPPGEVVRPNVPQWNRPPGLPEARPQAPQGAPPGPSLARGVLGALAANPEVAAPLATGALAVGVGTVGMWTSMNRMEARISGAQCLTMLCSYDTNDLQRDQTAGRRGAAEAAARVDASDLFADLGPLSPDEAQVVAEAEGYLTEYRSARVSTGPFDIETGSHVTVADDFHAPDVAVRESVRAGRRDAGPGAGPRGVGRARRGRRAGARRHLRARGHGGSLGGDPPL